MLKDSAKVIEGFLTGVSGVFLTASLMLQGFLKDSFAKGREKLFKVHLRGLYELIRFEGLPDRAQGVQFQGLSTHAVTTTIA